MEYAPLIFSNYAWLALWFAVCALQGLACWSFFSTRETWTGNPWPNPELALFFTITAGLAMQIAVLIILAMCQLLSPWPILIAQTGLTLACCFSLWQNKTAWNGFADTFRISRVEWLRILPILLLILPWAIRPLSPAGGSDPLTYHLPYAQFYLNQSGLSVNDTLRFPLHTHNINLLYAVGMLRPGATMPQLLHAGMGFLSLLGIYGMARHWNGWMTGIFAVAGVLLFKEFQLSFRYAFVDNGLTLFVTAAFLSLSLWVPDEKKQFLWFSALFAGTAMGIKYHGALFTVPLGLIVLWFSKDLKLTVRYALLTSVFGLFWYVRSWWISGNPVHPFAGEVFGYYIWTAQDLAGQMRELTGHGVEKNFLNFLQLPEKMFSEKGNFNGATGRGGILIGVFFASCLLIPWQKPVVRALQLTSLAWLLFWFWSSHIVRYLFPILPVMSLVAWSALSSTIVHSFRPLKKKDPDISSSGIFLRDAFLLPLFLLFLFVFSVREIDEDLSYPQLTEKQHAKFLAKWEPAYELMRDAAADGRINEGPLLQFRLPKSKYFFPGIIYGDWMGPYAYKKYGYIGPAKRWVINNPETLYQQVVSQGIKAVAMKKEPSIQFAAADLDSYRDYFEFIIETDKGIVMIPLPRDSH